MNSTTIAMDKTIVKKASRRAKNDSLSLSTVAKILLSNYADGFISIGTIIQPRSEIPNKQLEKDLKEAEAGIGVKTYKNADAMFKDLNN